MERHVDNWNYNLRFDPFHATYVDNRPLLVAGKPELRVRRLGAAEPRLRKPRALSDRWSGVDVDAENLEWCTVSTTVLGPEAPEAARRNGAEPEGPP